MSVLNFEKLEHAYIMTYENAKELIEEANILLDNEKYARAYFLAQIAYEEIGKLPIILHETTRALYKEQHDWKKFYKRLRSHDAKNQVNVIFDKISGFPKIDLDVDEIRDNTKRLNTLKNASLYSDLNEGEFIKPSSIVNEESAKARIRVAEEYMEFISLTKCHEQGNIRRLLNEDFAKETREIMKDNGLV